MLCLCSLPLRVSMELQVHINFAGLRINVVQQEISVVLGIFPFRSRKARPPVGLYMCEAPENSTKCEVVHRAMYHSRNRALAYTCVTGTNGVHMLSSYNRSNTTTT